MAESLRELGLPPETFNRPTANFKEITLDMANFFQETVHRVVKDKILTEGIVDISNRYKIIESNSNIKLPTYLGYKYLIKKANEPSFTNVLEETIWGNGLDIVFEMPDNEDAWFINIKVE